MFRLPGGGLVPLPRLRELSAGRPCDAGSVPGPVGAFSEGVGRESRFDPSPTCPFPGWMGESGEGFRHRRGPPSHPMFFFGPFPEFSIAAFSAFAAGIVEGDLPVFQCFLLAACPSSLLFASFEPKPERDFPEASAWRTLPDCNGAITGDGFLLEDAPPDKLFP